MTRASSAMFVVPSSTLMVALISLILLQVGIVKPEASESNSLEVRCTDDKLKSSELLTTLRAGLEFDGGRTSVIVVGAGIAGLTAAKLLKEANFDVLVIEASRRVGGRVQTFRHHEQGWLAELGAMRLTANQPFVMSMVTELLEQDLVPFVSSSSVDDFYVNNKLFKTFKLSETKQLRAINRAFRTPQALQRRSFSNFRSPDDIVAQAFAEPLEDLQSMNFRDFIRKYDKFSLKQWFTEKQRMAPSIVNMIGVFNNMEAFMGLSLIEAILDECLFENNDTTLYTLNEGMDTIATLLQQHVGKDRIMFNSRVERIDAPTLPRDKFSVYMGCKDVDCSGQSLLKSDYVIMTATAPLVLGIEFRPPLPVAKRLALRQASFMASSKVVLVFLRPFWEKRRVRLGGKTITDLPMKAIYYPIPWSKSGVGVMLASYTWALDSQRQSGMSDDDLIEECLRGLSLIYRLSLRSLKYLFLNARIKHWAMDPFSLGAFAYFQPLQYGEEGEVLRQPLFNRRMAFAGDYTDVPHGWIDTAIKSGVRAAQQIAKREGKAPPFTH